MPRLYPKDGGINHDSYTSPTLLIVKQFLTPFQGIGTVWLLATTCWGWQPKPGKPASKTFLLNASEVGSEVRLLWAGHAADQSGVGEDPVVLVRALPPFS